MAKRIDQTVFIASGFDSNCLEWVKMERLTKYASGSMGELMTIAWPLILSCAANSLMLLGDRFVLSHYSAAAFNASVGGLPWYWTLNVSISCIILICGVLVGRCNGAGDHKSIGGIVWQMIWLSLSLFLLTVPMAIWVVPRLLAPALRELGVPYLRILLIFLPVNFIAFGAMSSFFTGRGETKLVSLIVLISTAVNVGFDILLIFGYGIFPELGIAGAAWATVLSEFVGLFIFSGLFFQRKYRRQFRTLNCRFNGKILKECLRIGMPNATSCFVNFALWSWILQIMATCVSEANYFAFGVTQTVYSTFFFLIEGLGQAISTICSNAYGARAWDVIERNLRSAFKIALANGIFLSLFMVIFPRPLISLLMNGALDDHYFRLIARMLFINWLGMCVSECFTFCLRGALIAFGDTKFLMIASLMSYGCVVIVPSYFLLHITHDAASFLIIEFVSQILLLSAFLLRYRCHWVSEFHRMQNDRQDKFCESRVP